jgi:hypothetical protein
MATFVSNPLTVTLEAPTEGYRRADLELNGVDHSRASYEGRLFINNDGAGPDTPTSDRSYAGSFWVFGHGGCAGDEGHCDPPSRTRLFDFRAEHQLTPVTKRVIVTTKLKELVEPGRSFTVRIVPCMRSVTAEPLPQTLVDDLLSVEEVRLLTFQ